MSGDGDESLRINQEMTHLRKQLLSDYTAILREYGTVRPKWLKEYTLGTPARQEMLLYMYNKYNEDFRKMVGHGKSKKSYQRYVVVYRHLQKFILSRYGVEDIRLKYVIGNLKFKNNAF